MVYQDLVDHPSILHARAARAKLDNVSSDLRELEQVTLPADTRAGILHSATFDGFIVIN